MGKQARKLIPILILLSVIGCSGPTPIVNTPLVPTSTPTLTPVPANTPTPSPPPEGVLRVAMNGTQSYLDVQRSISEWSTLFGPGIAYNRLLRFVSGPNVVLPSMQVECDLCTHWEYLAPDKYIFHLNKNARWHDVGIIAGRSVDSEDVVFSLNRLMSVNSPNSDLLDSVESIKALGKNTVEIKVRYKDADLLQKLANPHLIILPRSVGKENEFILDPIVGTGPWTIERLRSGQMNFNIASGYHRSTAPLVSQLAMIPVGDYGAGAGAMLGGDIDVAQIDENWWLSLKEAGFQSLLIPRQGIGALLGINTDKAPFSSIDNRRAIFWGLSPEIDREQVWGDTAYSAVGLPVVRADWLLQKKDFARYFDKRSEARQVVSNLDEFQRKITLVVANFGKEYTTYGDIVASHLEKTGFEVEVASISRAKYLDKVWSKRDFQIFIGPLPPTSTTNDFAISLLHSKGQWNITGFKNSKLDTLIEAQSVEIDVMRRGEILRQIQSEILANALLFMPAITIERWAYSKRVKGFYPNLASGQGSFWEDVRVVPNPANDR